MASEMIRYKCEYVLERYATFAQKVSENPLMTMPFVGSGCVGGVLTGAAKVAGCMTSSWPLLQGIFVSCTAVHSALISPLQLLPTKRTTCQSFIKSTLHVAWSLRAGLINAVLFDFFKHLSRGLLGDNRYLACFWDIASVVAILPVVANPLCNFTTGMIIVGGSGVVSLAYRYIGDKNRSIPSQGYTPLHDQAFIPVRMNSESQVGRETFFDSGFKQFYFKPPEGKDLNELIEKYQVQGEYQGLGEGRRLRHKNIRLPGQPMELCDVVILKKSQDQIGFERNEEERRQEQGSLTSIFFAHLERIRDCCALELVPLKSIRERIQHRIIKQEEMAAQLSLEINSLLKTVWKDAYSSFLICGERELLELGYTKEEAQKMHALILFYKPLPSTESALTEQELPPGSKSWS